MAFGGNIQEVLIQLEILGFFDFVLPFLLVFAVVFGILSYTRMFQEQKAVNIIVAVILGFLAIRLPFFSAFLTEMSPRLGVGLVLLLSFVILIGMFTPEGYKDVVAWILLGVGAVTFIVILIQSANVLNYFGYNSGFFSGEVIGWIVMIGV
ncbi:MAG: hypothetical protein KC506_01175, partial [Nanoarchaeota archaeon]|nr:hypothetical protein [Nanoarchaeota archaeon]